MTQPITALEWFCAIALLVLLVWCLVEWLRKN